ncbi:MAG: SURF1 family protein [Betaproteobacteria bacterium]|nr:SURF1 family protein [Betaproteobacteria bacterium]
MPPTTSSTPRSPLALGHLGHLAALGRRRYAFRPRLWPTLATLALLPLLIGLGQWQLQRAATKAVLQAELEARAAQAPLTMPTTPATAEALRFHRIIARGVFEPERQILLDNQVDQGTAGYHVLTPLHLAHSDLRLLVDRGWVPAGADRQQLPAIPTPSGEVRLEGLAVVPSPRYFALAPEQTGSGIWQNLDLEHYRERMGMALQPVLLQLDPQSPAGFRRDWPRPDLGRERHLAYAWQWFGLAATLAIIWIVTNLERRP